MRKTIWLLVLVLAGTARPAAAEVDCTERALDRLQRAAPENLTLVYRDGRTLTGQLLAIERGERALRVLATEAGKQPEQFVSWGELREVRYRKPGRFQPLWMVVGLLGGGLIGAVIGSAADPPGDGFMDFGGGPAGFAIGAGAGLVLGTAIPMLIPTQRRLSCK